MHREPDAFLNQVVGGRWRLLEVLGATEHGAVYRVETVDAGRAARLELWDPRHVEQRGELARFEREARTLSRLQHERCISIAAFGAHEGRPYVVTDLPPGRTLRDELGKPELTVRRALSLGLQLCEALQHLHGHGVVHRALVPDNLWVGPSPSLEVLKLGLPRFGPPADRPGAARERLYLPPERPAGRTDTRGDLYAAGMLLYVMCTGREPAAEAAAAIAAGEPVPPPRAVAADRGIGEGLERVILRAVAPAPDVRFKTAGELMEALQSAGARPPSPGRRP
ncbi:MAG TPA: serine/threonine-protein kinase, partial [Polyangia bacterium]|nr:serine/threonine-protein kinase [Polyangia bacterium]